MSFSATSWPWSKSNRRRGAAEPAPMPAESKPQRRRMKRIVAAASWSYLAVAVALWVFLHVAGDRWWFAQFIVFGPRWVVSLPAALLVPMALLVRRRSLWALAAALGVVVGPVMGLCVPWHRVFTAEQPGLRLRVMTCNVHGKSFDPRRMAALIDEVGPDVVASQENEPDCAVPCRAVV